MAGLRPATDPVDTVARRSSAVSRIGERREVPHLADLIT